MKKILKILMLLTMLLLYGTIVLADVSSTGIEYDKQQNGVLFKKRTDSGIYFEVVGYDPDLRNYGTSNEVVIPKSIFVDRFLGYLPVKKVSNSAFEGNANITKLTIEAHSGLVIGESAFADMTAIQEITINGQPLSFEEHCFQLKNSLKELTLDNVTSLGPGTGIFCSKIGGIEIGTLKAPNLESINYMAFTNVGIETLDLPEVKRIGSTAFCRNRRLISVNMPKVEYIDSCAFASCSSLKEMFIPDTCTKLGSYSIGYYNDSSGDFVPVSDFRMNFDYTSQAHDYAVEAGWHTFDNAFTIDVLATVNKAGSKSRHCMNAGCIGKTNVTEIQKLPKNGTVLTYDKLKYKVTSSGKGVVYVSCLKPTSTSLTSVVIPAQFKKNDAVYKVTSIADKAFYKNTKMTSLEIGSNVKTIGKYAFACCSALKKVSIKSTLLYKFDYRSFYGCKYLTSITIPKNVKYIGKQAFYGCKKLKKIDIKTTKLTKQNVYADAFKGIYGKATIMVPAKKLSSYRTILKSRGVSSSAAFTPTA